MRQEGMGTIRREKILEKKKLKEPNKRGKVRNLLWLLAKMFMSVGGKVYKDLIPVTAICVDRKFTVGAVRLRPTFPQPAPPSALTGPGMCELCTLARMNHLHLVISQQEQTHNLAKFTACINTRIAKYLCLFISMNKYGICAGLQTAKGSPEANEKNELPSKVTL